MIKQIKSPEWIEKVATEARDRLSPLRIRLWLDWKHAYQCGYADGIKHVIGRVEKTREKDIRNTEDIAHKCFFNATREDLRKEILGE